MTSTFTAPEKEFTGVASAAKDFFGDHPNGTTKFLIEWKNLSDADKAEIRAGLEAMGYRIIAK